MCHGRYVSLSWPDCPFRRPGGTGSDPRGSRRNGHGAGDSVNGDETFSHLEGAAIVLVRPESPGNVGAVARIIRNFGLGELRLVQPADRDLLSNREAGAMAHRSGDILAGASVFPTLRDALGDRRWVVAASGRDGRERMTLVPVRSMAREIVALLPDAPGALVFGPESDGLSERDLSECDRVLTIPQRRPGPALNLAQAVAVVASELFQAVSAPGGPVPAPPASRESAGRMIRRMARVARHSGMTVRNRPEEMAEALSGIFRSHDYTEYDVAVLERWLSQVEWFTGLAGQPIED